LLGFERGHPQQNGRHERMHLTLKKEATRPLGTNSLQQHDRFDAFVQEFNVERPHEALGMKCPAELYTASNPDRRPRGRTTFYLEDRKSRVNLKCYIRPEKLTAGGFSGLIVRLEWTLTGTRALTRHSGGNQINDLMTADLNAFLERNIRLERVDHVAFGKLFRGVKSTGTRDRSRPLIGKAASMVEQWDDPKYRAERAAHLVLRALAYRELDKFASWEQGAMDLPEFTGADTRLLPGIA
jgi:hypothetical protein